MFWREIVIPSSNSTSDKSLITVPCDCGPRQQNTMKSVSPLILSILPLITKASFYHDNFRLLLFTPPQRVITTNHNLCRSYHNHNLHLTTATAAPTTTTLQLLRQYKFPPRHNYYTNCEQHAMPKSNSDHKAINDSSASENNNNCNYSQMKILGICGGIGSGKSTASQLMVTKLGCADLIDADKLAHAVYEPGSLALEEIVDEFGTDILLHDDNGGKKMIDRKKLGAIVFKDAKSMSVRTSWIVSFFHMKRNSLVGQWLCRVTRHSKWIV
jgi:hypothetical protein